MPTTDSARKLEEYDEYVSRHRRREKHMTPGEKIGCIAGCSKKGLLMLNIVFLIFGCVIIGIGVHTLRADTTRITSVGLARGIVALGSIVTVVSFLGCFGALRHSRRLLAIYAMMLACLIICQVVIAGLLLRDQNKADSLIADAWNDSSESTRCDLQRNFDCCGLEESDTQIPTCPNDTPTQCVPDPPTLPYCKDKLKDELESNFVVLGAIGVAFGLFEIFGFLFAMCLRCDIEKPLSEEEADLEDARRVNRSYQ